MLVPPTPNKTMFWKAIGESVSVLRYVKMFNDNLAVSPPPCCNAAARNLYSSYRRYASYYTLLFLSFIPEKPECILLDVDNRSKAD